MAKRILNSTPKKDGYRMPGVAIVARRYLAGGGLTGAVALVGSNRMAYHHLIPILEYFATKLGQSMSGKKQEEQI